MASERVKMITGAMIFIALGGAFYWWFKRARPIALPTRIRAPVNIPPPVSATSFILEPNQMSNQIPPPVSSTAPYAASRAYPGGLAINNPGNVRFNPANHWQGQTGSVKGPGGLFATFDTMENGLRAMAIIILRLWERYPTIRAVVSTYSPSSENPASLPNVYARAMGVLPDQAVDLKNVDLLVKYLDVAIRIENGKQPISSYALKNAAQKAIDYIG